MGEAARVAGFDLTHLYLFPMPNVDDVEGHLLAQDVVWVNGGSVANLLAVWRVHGLDAILRRVWQAGVVLGRRLGRLDLLVPRRHHRLVRARAAGGDQRPGLAALRQRRALRLRGGPPAARCTGWWPTAPCPTTHCTDDGVGLVYRGTELVEAVSEVDGKGAYVVTRDGDKALERTPGRAATGAEPQRPACAGPDRSSTGAGPSPGVITRDAVPLSALDPGGVDDRQGVHGVARVDRHGRLHVVRLQRRSDLAVEVGLAARCAGHRRALRRPS